MIVQHLQALDTMLKVLDIGSFNEFVSSCNRRVRKQVEYASPRWYAKFIKRHGDRVRLRNASPLEFVKSGCVVMPDEVELFF